MAENLANSPRINKIEAVKQWLRDRDPVRDAAAAGNPYAEQMLRLDEFGERIGERFLREKEDRSPNKMSEISIDVGGYHMPLIVPESTPEELLYLGSLMASGKKLDFEDPFMQQIRQKAVDNFVQSLQSTGEYVRGVTGFKPFEGEGAPYGYRHKTNVPKSEGWQGLIDIGGDAEDSKQFLRGENEMPNVPEMRGGGMMGFRPLGYKDGGTPSSELGFEPTESAAQFLENLRTKHPVAFIEHVFHTHGIPREETRQQLEEEGILPPEGLITFENRGEFNGQMEPTPEQQAPIMRQTGGLVATGMGKRFGAGQPYGPDALPPKDIQEARLKRLLSILMPIPTVAVGLGKRASEPPMSEQLDNFLNLPYFDLENGLRRDSGADMRGPLIPSSPSLPSYLGPMNEYASPYGPEMESPEFHDAVVESVDALQDAEAARKYRMRELMEEREQEVQRVRNAQLSRGLTEAEKESVRNLSSIPFSDAHRYMDLMPPSMPRQRNRGGLMSLRRR